jgi:uncharacterized membrane protein
MPEHVVERAVLEQHHDDMVERIRSLRGRAIGPIVSAEETQRQPRGFRESRWPPAATLAVFMGLNIGLRLWQSRVEIIGVPWLLPGIEALTLVALIAGDPYGVDKRAGRLRRATIVLVCVLVLAAMWATALLVYHLVTGAKVVQSAGELLAVGALVYLGNNVAFALLYWLMDDGGPLKRAGRDGVPVDLAFTQQLSPEIAPAGWRPVFLDYLHLGFTNATAFSPTDVMPLTHRAKFAMLVHSTVALALFGLIVARAVNAFT